MLQKDSLGVFPNECHHRLPEIRYVFKPLTCFVIFFGFLSVRGNRELRSK